MVQMKELPKNFLWKVFGVVLLTLATACGSLWLLRCEKQAVRTGEDSMERFLQFSEEIDAILVPYGINAEVYTSVSDSDVNDAEERYAFLRTCIPLEDGYQLYYGMRYENWSGEQTWCMLISPLKDSVEETKIDLSDERFASFFAVAEILTNTYSAKRFQTYAGMQQRRMFRFAKDNPKKVEGSYRGHDPETIVEEEAAFEHGGLVCSRQSRTWSYCLGVWVDVDCAIYKYKTQYYSAIEITSDLNRA